MSFVPSFSPLLVFFGGFAFAFYSPLSCALFENAMEAKMLLFLYQMYL